MIFDAMKLQENHLRKECREEEKRVKPEIYFGELIHYGCGSSSDYELGKSQRRKDRYSGRYTVMENK